MYDEDFWPFENLNICEEKLNSYYENVDLGKKICEKSKVAVISLARNCDKKLQDSIDRIINLKSFNFKFFIYENNSVDRTKEILIFNKNNLGFDISLNEDKSTHLTDRSRQRTKNLAKYRNICLEWARSNCSDFDYALVLDLDADLGFSINGIYNSISWLNKIKDSAGMGSYSLILENKKIKHYDIFALRLKSWLASSEKPSSYEDMLSSYNPEIGSEPSSFYSCFGGLAVYKMKVFLQGCYDGSIGCEHVLFHKSLRDKGYNMYLNPSSRFFVVKK